MSFDKRIFHIVLFCLVLTGLMPGPGSAYAGTDANETPVVGQMYLPMIRGGSNSNPPPPPPPARRGFFALDDFLTYNAATVVDGQGGVHLAFYSSDERHQDNPRGQPAYYVYCPGPAADCTDPAQWSGLVQMDSQVNEVQIVVTKARQPRILTRTNGSNGYDYHYWACNQQCTNAENWAGLFVTSAAGADINGTYSPQHSFALDSQDRPRFAYSNSWGNSRRNGIWYAYCDAVDCTELDTWQQTPIFFGPDDKTTTSDNLTLKFFGNIPHVLTRLNFSGLADNVMYLYCEENCEDGLRWRTTLLLHPEFKRWASWDLELDGAGRPRVALFEPAPIDITVGGKLFFGKCDDTCWAVDNWQLVPVASGEGKNVDLAIDAQGRTHMVYDAGQRGTVAESWCDANCTTASQWQRRILETSTELTTEFPVAVPISCDQEERMWTDAIPTIDFDSQGKMVVAYDAVHYAVCYYRDPANPQKPPVRKVERIWWAVRWALFARS